MTRLSRRRGFTLVELLVALALIIVLMALAVAIYPNLANSQRVVRSADRVSAWLIIAKEQAKRDGAPRGVRFYVTGNQVTECQYIEQPNYWVPNPLQEAEIYNASGTPASTAGQGPNGGRIVLVQTVNPSSTPANQVATREAYFVSNDYTEFNQRINAGCMLYLPEWGGSYRILNNAGTDALVPVTLGTAPVQAKRLVLSTYPEIGAGSSAAATGTLTTYKFGFQTGVDTLMGEPILLLGSNTIVDWRNPAGPDPVTTLNVTNTAGYFDILFSPTGQVMNNSNGIICLWMRDPEQTPHPRLPDDATGFDAAGEQVLVVVYTRTGMIATQPVTRGTDPYSAAKDGVNIGL